MSGTALFDSMEKVVNNLDKNAVYYLHKPGLYDSPDNKRAYFIPENGYFCKPDTARMDFLAGILPLCYGWHNGRIVLDYGGYFVGTSIEELCDKFTLSRISKKGEETRVLLTNEAKRKLCSDLIKFANAARQFINLRIGLETDLNPRYIGFNCTEGVTDNPIATKIANYYDNDLQGLDIRTKTPLSKSYFTMIGWLFSSVEKKRRFAGCFECPTSGVGKTGFIRAFCNRTDVVHSQLAQSVDKANRFSFSSAMAIGPDIVTVDDPGNGTEEILSYTANLVSNKQGEVELKGKDKYIMDDLDSKVIITTNKTLYYRNDQCNFMTAKLFVLKTNELQPDNGQASEIIDYINHCDRSEVDAFISYCVGLYAENGDDWVKDHLGTYIDEEERTNMFEDIVSYDKVKNARLDRTTLIECLNDDMTRSEHDRDRNERILYLWNTLTKTIKSQWPDLARECRVSVPRDNDVYPIGNRPSKDRYKNFVITAELQKIILEYLKPDSSTVDYDALF